MKTKIVLAGLFLCLALATQEGFGVFLVDDDTILSQTKQAVLIVAGKVSVTQYVQPDMRIARVYTDVTIAVSKTFKGTPNINKNTVRFRVEGGMGIPPKTGKMFLEEVSSTPKKFEVGQELILFLVTRSLDGWGSFYDGLYPIAFPPYPEIHSVDENSKVARFRLAFFDEHYRLNVPVEVAFRLIKNAIDAPEDFAVLEQKIRPLKDVQRLENRDDDVEAADFLLMLNTELTKIEAKIAERKAQDKQ